MNFRQKLLCFVRAPMFTPQGFVVRALLLTLIFLILELLGLRAYTCILCGSSPTGGAADSTLAILAVIYILSYFAAVLLVPILLIAAAIFWFVLQLFTSRSS